MVEAVKTDGPTAIKDITFGKQVQKYQPGQPGQPSQPTPDAWSKQTPSKEEVLAEFKKLPPVMIN